MQNLHDPGVLQKFCIMFGKNRDVLARLSAAACLHADQTISSPAWGAMRFGPLGPTSRSSSRYTFLMIRLGSVLPSA